MISPHSPLSNRYANQNNCHSEEVSKAVAITHGYFMALGISFAILTILIWARFSDVRGRRTVLRLCYISIVLSHCLTMLSLLFWRLSGLSGLYATAIIQGIFGGPSLLMATCYAMLTDVLHETERMTWYARAIGIMYAARIIGPSIGSYLLNQRLLLPIYVTTVLATLNFITVLCLPETLNKNSLPLSDRQGFSMIRHFKESIEAIQLCGRNNRMLLITFASFAYFFSFPIVSILVQYVNVQCHWSMEKAGFLTSLHAAAKFVVAVILLPIVKNFINNRWTTNSTTLNVSLVVFSFAIDSGSWLFVAVLPRFMLIPSLALGTLGVGLSASLRVLAAEETTADQNGRLFACFGVVDALGILFASPVLAATYSATMSSYPEAAFVLVAAIFGICAVIFVQYKNCTGSHKNHVCAEHDTLYQSLDDGFENTDIALGK